MEIEIKNSNHIKNMLDDFINNSHVVREPIIFTNSDTLEVPPYDFGPEHQRAIRLWVLAIMFTVSLIGNTIVVHQILSLRRGRFPKSKVLLLNLAAADLLVTFGSMLSQLIWELMDHQWIAGDAFCKSFKFLQTYSLSSSTFMVVAIALDRYNAIMQPLSFSRAPKWYAIGAWTMGLLPSFPCFFVFHEVQISDTETKCVSKFYTSPESQMWRKVYMMFVFVIVFLLPFALLLGVYVIIIKEIRKHSSVFTANQQTASSLPRARVKTLKMTNAILFSFLIINLPYIVQETIIALGYAEILNGHITAFAGVVSASNSAINPYIYLVFHTSIKECLSNFLNALRSSQWSMSSHRKNNTSFLSASSKTSSRTHMNLVTTFPHTQGGRVTSSENGDKKSEETFL